MPVSSIVLALSPVPLERDDALRELASLEGITVGPRSGDRVAVVTETPSTRACTALLERIGALEGVHGVFPVFHDFSDEPLDPTECD